ncbi:MAG TPA: flavin reductase [Polyangiaceae bacterium]|nr:flavin reductase [Polyangiaceae bacterium]
MAAKRAGKDVVCLAELWLPGADARRAPCLTSAMYRTLPLERFFLEIEEGPVVLIATRHLGVDNVMCLSWLMPLGFSRDDCDIAVMTGPWNKSFDALMGSRVCTINVPTESLMKQAIQAGTMSVTEGDKFSRLGLARGEAMKIDCPVIVGCASYAAVKLVKYLRAHSILILRPVEAAIDPKVHKERKFHAVGDGTFFLDGERRNYRRIMKDKIPAHVARSR